MAYFIMYLRFFIRLWRFVVDKTLLVLFSPLIRTNFGSLVLKTVDS